MEKDTKSPAEALAVLYAQSDIEAGSIDKKNEAPTSRFSQWGKLLSVETGGIQRVTDEERQHNTTKVWNACTFW